MYLASVRSITMVELFDMARIRIFNAFVECIEAYGRLTGDDEDATQKGC